MKSILRCMTSLILCLASLTCVGAAEGKGTAAEGKATSLGELCAAKSTVDPKLLVVDPSIDVPRTVVRRELLPRYQRLPSGRTVDLMMVTDPKPTLSDTDYKVLALDASAKAGTPNVFSLSEGNGLEAAIADRKLTDFSAKDDSRDKMLLAFRLPPLGDDVASLVDPDRWYRRVDVYVLACSTTPVPELKAFGHVRSTVTSQGVCRIVALLFLILVYAGAALCMSSIRESKRGRLWHTSQSKVIGFWGHLDPVVLSSGDDGRGSATKLQMLFFTMIVLWLVFYIWLMTEHLSELSTTVLLLMGIAGVGATAAAGADLTKNRLALDNWAWLVNKNWLPQGGISAVNQAKWRDVFTTNGVFDVPRFQLVTFSVVVGFGLLASGADLADLSTYSIPTQLLSILGLSQVVYVAGKLVAPPSVSELDAQILKVREAEGVKAKAQAALDQARNTPGAATDAPRKALDEANAALAAAEGVARTAFVAIYQIPPSQYYKPSPDVAAEKASLSAPISPA
jgi:hypothetical protein